ncbi:MAG: hypothetical protein A2001_04635 [Treponema sp. GWC1_61_84]|nr:MAG: hypothetical protein A2001_04635 [Treponema sp. GWC1_61_84]
MKTSTGQSTRAALAASMLVVSHALFGQSATVPRIEPSAAAVAYGVSADSLSWEQALDLALWASSVPGLGGPKPAEEARTADARQAASRLAASRKAVTDAAADLARELPPSATEAEAADFVLRFMHRRFLKSYSERQTRLDLLTESGRYNCVSSAALYAVLALSIGLDVSAVASSDHAFCVVRADGMDYDVETTNPWGFDPGSKKEFHDSFGTTTGFAYVSPKDYRNRKTMGVKELFSLILSNRIVELESSRRYSEAVGLSVDRWTLLGSPAEGDGAYGELLGRLLNYGSSLAMAGKESEALAWAGAAVAAFGPNPRWTEFRGTALNNLVVGLLRRSDVGAARARLDAEGGTVPPRMKEELERAIAATELAEAIKAAERVARTDGWRAGLAALDAVNASSADPKALADARRVFRGNRIAELHNRFAALYNARSYAEAREAAAEAVAEFPDDTRLKADLETAERALVSSGAGR